jgi:hypothetical protein
MTAMLSFYKLKTTSGHFIAKVENMTDYYRVHIGAKKKCMIIDVYLDGDEANLTAIGYNENCSLDGNMFKGPGTVAMVKAGLKFTKNVFQMNMSSIQLKDMSVIYCKKHFELPLSILYLAKYNQTWYEKNFGAIPIDFQNEYEIGKANLKTYLKTKPDADSLFEHAPFSIRQPLKDRYLNPNIRSINDFISGLSSSDCYIFNGWLPTLVNRFVHVYGNHWRIMFNQLNLENFDLDMESLPSQPDDLFSMRGGDDLSKQVIFTHASQL